MATVALLLVGSLAGSAAATTTWSPGPRRRTINDPKACTNVPYSGPTCITGGQFPDGPPAFATAVNGSTHYWYAAWTSDRPPANEQMNLIPYGSVCATVGNPNSGAHVTAASFATNAWNLSAYSESDVTRNLLGGPGTGGPVSITEVEATATAYLDSAFSAPYALEAGDTVTIAGTDQAAYNGTFTIASVPSENQFTFTTSAPNNPDATGGTATIHAATFDTSAANTLDANSLITIGGASPAPYDGTWSVSSAVSSTEFVANIGASAASGSTGTATEYDATFTTAAGEPGAIAVGGPLTVSGFSGASAGYNGTWTARAEPTPTTFTADLATAPATSPASGTGFVTVSPYCSGVFFTRSSDGGATWEPPVSLSDPLTHADRYSIAASGNYVYAIWTSTVGYYSQLCNDSPRVMYFDVSSDYGATWSEPTTTRLSPVSDRVDYPSMAAGPLGSGSSGDVYVVDTETPGGTSPIGNTASVYLYLSHDRGATWTKTQVGTTTATFDNRVGKGSPTCPNVGWSPPSVEGNSGVAAVAGDGTNIGVAWATNDLGHAVARISTDDGTSWSAEQDLTLSGARGAIDKLSHTSCPSGGSSNGYGACGHSFMSVASDWSNHRLGFAWVDDTCLTVTGWYLTCGGGNSAAPAGVYARVWTASGGWGSGTLVSCFTLQGGCAGSPDRRLKGLWDGYAPSVAFYGTTGVAVAWTACRRGKGEAQPCDGGFNDPGPEIAYKESGDGGATWMGDWSTGASTVKVVASDAVKSFTNCASCDVYATVQSRVNEWPTLVFDKPGAPYSGCAQRAGGSPELGCEKVVYFLGRNTGYTFYRMYLQIGTVG